MKFDDKLKRKMANELKAIVNLEVDLDWEDFFRPVIDTYLKLKNCTKTEDYDDDRLNCELSFHIAEEWLEANVVEFFISDEDRAEWEANHYEIIRDYEHSLR